MLNTINKPCTTNDELVEAQKQPLAAFLFLYLAVLFNKKLQLYDSFDGLILFCLMIK